MLFISQIRLKLISVLTTCHSIIKNVDCKLEVFWYDFHLKVKRTEILICLAPAFFSQLLPANSIYVPTDHL